MFADPQSVTINAVAHSLARVSSDARTSVYSNADGSVQENVAHTVGKRIRSTIGLTQSKYATDPLYPTQNVPRNMTIRLVVDKPSEGFSVTEQKYLYDALVAQLGASSGLLITKLLGGES